MSLERFIKFIKEGESVAPGTPNRPLRQLDQNVQYLWDVIEAANLGSTVYARQVTVDSTVELGMPVYWNSSESRFDAAVAKMDSDPITGYLSGSPSSEVWGIVAEKHEADLADILLFGYAKIDISAATGSTGGVPAGTYYLSGMGEGKLVVQKPAVTVAVLRADGEGNVYVNPSFMDFLSNHQHYMFDLTMLPAGDTAPPTFDGIGRLEAKHHITNANTALTGWLPADNAVFEGNAPAGAKFGYNIPVEPGLSNMFPPIPLKSVDVELLRPSIYTTPGIISITDDFFVSGSGQSIADGGTWKYNVNVANVQQLGQEDQVIVNPTWTGSQDVADGLTIFGAYNDTSTSDLASPSITLFAQNFSGSTVNVPAAGIKCTVTIIKNPENWKMIKLAGQALDDLVQVDRNGIWWMSNCYDEVPWPTDYTTGDSVSYSLTGCPSDARPQMKLYFTKINLATDDSVVRSLNSIDTRLKIYCANSTMAATTGDLDIDLDLSFVITEGTSGYQVLKSLEGETFARGPIAEGIYTTNPANTILAGDLSETVNIGGDDQTVYRGNVKVNVTQNPTLELSSQIVRLDGATEENNPALYIGLSKDYASSYIVKFDVPTDAAGDEFTPSFRIIGRGVGTLPQLTFKVAVTSIPVVAAVVSLTYVDISSTIVTTKALSVANMAVQITASSPIAVDPGDQVYIEVARTAPASDGYGGEVGIMQQIGSLGLHSYPS